MNLLNIGVNNDGIHLVRIIIYAKNHEAPLPLSCPLICSKKTGNGPHSPHNHDNVRNATLD